MYTNVEGGKIMLDIDTMKKIIKDRKLFLRAKTEMPAYYQFAYCVSMDKFVDCDISYNAYTNNEYIIFRRYNNGEIKANRPLKAHLPLDILECGSVSSKEFCY